MGNQNLDNLAAKVHLVNKISGDPMTVEVTIGYAHLMLMPAKDLEALASEEGTYELEIDREALCSWIQRNRPDVQLD